MPHTTVGKEYGKGRIVPVDCIENPTSEQMLIRDECFLLLFITRGTAAFSVYGRRVTATAPCLICFDESEDPCLLHSRDLHCWGVFFHPTFLNVNLTFSRLRAEGFDETAMQHDFFLLQPFLRRADPIPMTDGYRLSLQNSCQELIRELAQQPDWYWSCRSRTYVMEMLIALERLYMYAQQESGQRVVQDALSFMESHYGEVVTLERLSAFCRVNRTTLCHRVREETGLTPREYLLQYRMTVAKKHLAFTEMPIKEIAQRCGFKTVQHFGRLFREREGMTPAAYRTEAVRRRREELQKEEVRKG